MQRELNVRDGRIRQLKDQIRTLMNTTTTTTNGKSAKTVVVLLHFVFQFNDNLNVHHRFNRWLLMAVHRVCQMEIETAAYRLSINFCSMKNDKRIIRYIPITFAEWIKIDLIQSFLLTDARTYTNTRKAIAFNGEWFDEADGDESIDSDRFGWQ